MPKVDFNGDGRSDVLLLSYNSGLFTVRFGAADGGFAASPFGWQDYPIWASPGFGDFNGDGLTDTLWYDGNKVSISLTSPGGKMFETEPFSHVATISWDWTIIGTGDFNGDGKADILWQHYASGIVTNWLGKGGTAFENNHVNTGNLMPNSSLTKIGDFNGDGFDDLLWRDRDGNLQCWFGKANGGFDTATGWKSAWVPTDWYIVGAGDFNGDGRDDLLWRHMGGTIVSWLGQADGSFVNNHVATGQVVPTDWRVVSVDDYDGDGRDDILWSHEARIFTNWLGQPDGGFVNNHGNSLMQFDDLTITFSDNPGAPYLWDGWW